MVADAFTRPDGAPAVGRPRAFETIVYGGLAVGVLDVPCLWYTLLGRFSLRGDEPHAREQEVSDKADATDINL